MRSQAQKHFGEVWVGFVYHLLPKGIGSVNLRLARQSRNCVNDVIDQSEIRKCLNKLFQMIDQEFKECESTDISVHFVAI